MTARAQTEAANSPQQKKKGAISKPLLTESEMLVDGGLISGRRLDRLLELLGRAVAEEIGQIRDSSSKKAFFQRCKALFYIGINDVTRALERMPPVQADTKLEAPPDPPATQNMVLTDSSSDKTRLNPEHTQKYRMIPKSSHLQVVVAAGDVHPRLLVSHLPDLAASRNVPLLTISGGNGTGSMRLGEIFHLRTTIAIGLKVGDSAINNAMKTFLKEN